ncbi:8-oxo-dGTP diphosphatase [Cryobacterium sp. CAN_C3]|nr:8-oxo-dGTP diphosphatase [Cryobacterium sp. CAN_C3]
MCDNCQVTNNLGSHGKRLTDYPRPSVAVDTAVLTVHDDQLCVALVPAQTARRLATGPALRRLPGTFVHEGETLADAVRRSLADKAGIRGLSPVQLQVFDAPGRDDRGWVMSVAHIVVVPHQALADVAVVPVSAAQGLAFDHDQIVELALARLRLDYTETPDPARLLGDEFTLLALQRLHESVSGERLMRDTFRRGMERKLEPTGQLQTGTVGKPARLFRRLL